MNHFTTAFTLSKGVLDLTTTPSAKELTTLAMRGLSTQPGGYVIAVDFDGTLCESDWPNIGEAKNDVIEQLQLCRQCAIKIVLWTCREGEHLEKALKWCEEYEIKFDAVNANTAERMAYYGNDIRKIGADEYWDDKAVAVG